MQCYNYQDWGHFAKECRIPKKLRQRNDEVRMAKEEDSKDEHVILMVTTTLEGKPEENSCCYLVQKYLIGRKKIFET